MTSTSVKDVSTVMKAFAANVTGGKGSAQAVSFQDIWNSQSGQTAQNTASDASAAKSGKAADSREKLQRGNSLQQKEVKRADSKDNLSTDETQPEEPDGRTLEEMMELLGTAAEELMQEIADTFGMSMEELKQLMADMNMDALDVLDAGKLSALLLAAGGAEDSLALLTDEELCGNFQALMNSRQEMAAEISEELQVTPEELTQLLQEGQELLADAEALAVTEGTDTVEKPLITVETDTDTAQAENPNAADGTADTLTENAVARTEPEQKNQTGGQERHTDSGSNFLMQNLKADNLQPQVQQAAENTSVWSENTQDIMNQIMDYMKLQLKADTSSLEMQLHPASLGTLQVNVASKGGVLTANFITQNEAVKAVLESQMIQLKESFAEQGVRVEAIEVTVQTHQFERNLEQGRGRQQNEPEKKSRVRRINLNGESGAEEAESLTQEEQLAADMMTANGSTVDYTA